MTDNNTICAISTPHGVGGIAVARVSGPDALAVAGSIWKGKNLSDVSSHTAHLGTVIDCDGEPLDQAVATVFRAPASFTGEDVVEIAVHGSIYVQQQLVNSLIAAGATLAQPGEFTRRAFMAGKMDLAQAEAVADVIASESKAAHRIAVNQMRGRFSDRLKQLRDKLLELVSLLELELDFSEEDVEFASRQHLLAIAEEVKAEVDRLAGSFRAATAIKNGIPVAIVGATNAGKSSLLNALLGDDRAIVSDVHGTTRDIVEDTLNIGDYTFRLMDTAGMRDTDDVVESMGIERSLKASRKADIVVVVVDSTDPKVPQLPDTETSYIIAVNKVDLEASTDLPKVLAELKTRCPDARVVEICAAKGEGIDDIARAMESIALASEGGASSVLVANARHYEALLQAGEAITRAIDGIRMQLSGDLISIDLRLTIHHLGSILGTITSDEILATIFSRFCIGK